MTQRMYSWRDRVAEQSNPIFFCKNDGLAVRAVKKHMEESKLVPEEYELLYLGTFDDETTKFDICDPPKSVVF